MNKGIHSILWNGTNDNGNPVGSGMYIYRMKAGDTVNTKRMILMK
jgi:flagellar hook assembly protein FlgD